VEGGEKNNTQLLHTVCVKKFSVTEERRKKRGM
jgi:hypothetical protein